MAVQTREHFRRTLGWVAIVHLVFLLFLGAWSLSRPKPPEPIKFLNMLPVGNLVHGRPGPSEGPVVGKKFEAPAPAPPAPSTPSRPQPPKAVEPPPEPTPAPEPTVAPEPTPTPAPKLPDPTSWSQEKAKPPKVTKPVAKPTPAPATEKPKIKVDLNEIERPSNSTRSRPSTQLAKAQPSDVDGTEPGGKGKAREGVRGMTAEGVAERLGKELKASGVDKAVGIGPSGSPNGSGTGENAWYYTLIRDQMYQAWNMPISLAGKKLQTLIRIFVEKNGTITKVDLVRSSGNKEHDDSALAAVHRVGRIRAPLPEGMDGNIDINFRLTE